MTRHYEIWTVMPKGEPLVAYHRMVDSVKSVAPPLTKFYVARCPSPTRLLEAVEVPCESSDPRDGFKAIAEARSEDDTAYVIFMEANALMRSFPYTGDEAYVTPCSSGLGLPWTILNMVLASGGDPRDAARSLQGCPAIGTPSPTESPPALHGWSKLLAKKEDTLKVIAFFHEPASEGCLPVDHQLVYYPSGEYARFRTGERVREAKRLQPSDYSGWERANVAWHATMLARAPHLYEVAYDIRTMTPNEQSLTSDNKHSKEVAFRYWEQPDGSREWHRLAYDAAARAYYAREGRLDHLGKSWEVRLVCARESGPGLVGSYVPSIAAYLQSTTDCPEASPEAFERSSIIEYEQALAQSS